MKQKTSSSDALVLELIDTVKCKQKEIEKIANPRWKTKCTIGYNPESVTDRINIQTVTDVSKLVALYGHLILQERLYKEATEALGLTPTEFKWMGETLESWKQDFQARIDQINISIKRSELKKLETQLDSLLTVEQKRELELNKIREQLNSN